MNPLMMNPSDALLIVDVQKDFCCGGSLAVEEGDEVVPVINRWITAAEQCGAKVVASRDWHPGDHVSFQARGGRWPEHCVQETEGAAFHDELRLPRETEIVSKGIRPDRDNYSAFDGTSLADELRRANIERVFVAGLAQDVCVFHTAMDARQAGFETHLIEDATRPVDSREGTAAVEKMKQAGVFIDCTDAS